MSTTTRPSLPVSARPGAKKSFNVPNWAYWVGIGLLVFVFLLVMTLMFGRLSGEEFSPHDFQRRTFHYYELPVVRLQVWPVKRFDTTGDVETKLVTSKVITPKKVDEPRWDLVRVYRGTTPLPDFDANILCRYLDQWDIQKREYTWLAWTTENAELAKVFWQQVAKLAQQELYFFLPNLFELAQSATDADALDGDLKQLMAQQYHDFGLVQQRLGHHDAAVELLTEALALEPKNEAWKAELATSQKALPKDEPGEKKSP